MQLQRLTESIQYVEDLPVDEFIDVLRNMSRMVAQEKLDGSNLWIGVDEAGKLFTSREGKRSGAERRYSSVEWPELSANNQFRAAHTAMEKVQDQIKLVLRSGDTVEAEVLFGEQPNSVTYNTSGMSYIAFLRGVDETPDTIAEQLANTLRDKTVEVTVDLVESANGRDLETVDTLVKFQFIQPEKINLEKVGGSVEPMLGKLEKFLNTTSPVNGFTNGELALVSLNEIPKDRRLEIKTAREEVLAKIQTDFKLPIKTSLLDTIVRKLRDTDDGAEGVVLRDQETGKQVKVVDKDVFTAVNRFNQAIRARIQGPLNTVDPDASLEARGGLMGKLRIRIAEFLGNRELAKQSAVRKILEPIKGSSPQEAIQNFAKTMPSNDDPAGIKRKILAIIADTVRELDVQLDTFNENKDKYRLKLKNGKELGLSKDTIKKTLAVFAEARRNLNLLFDKIKSTKTVSQILAVLYGNSAKAVHTSVTESLLLEKKHGEIALSQYEKLTTFDLLNTYYITVMMSMIMYHTGDRLGLRDLRDRKNYLMKMHDHSMSPLNHWGYAVWKCYKPEVTKHVGKKVSDNLHEITKKIPKTLWKNMHMQFSYDKDIDVNWADAKKTMRRLMDLSGVRSDRLNTLLDIAVRFDRLSYGDQLHGIKQLVAFARRFVPVSRLFVRLLAIEEKLKRTKEKMITESLLKTVDALIETADGGGGGGGGATATTAGDVAALPMRIGSMQRRTEMRTRNKAVLDFTKKFKDPRKENK